MSTKKPPALREWRYPRTYRTIFAREPRSIYQSDVMHLGPLWNNFLNKQEIQTLALKNFALVCIDIYSRYVWAVAIDNQQAHTILGALIKIFVHMGKPKIFQADNKIITKQIQNDFSKYFPDITLSPSKPGETNKNAIVERVIKTIKYDLLKYLFTYGLPKQPSAYDITTTIIQHVCSLRNHTFHRTIKQRPIDVFYDRAVNRQIIVRKTYPQFKVGQPVFIKPLRERGDISIKPFRFDYDIYVIIKKDGDKYQVNSLYNFLHEEVEEEGEPKKLWYKPYELRSMTYGEAYEHLNSPLVQRYLTHIYGTPDVIKEYLKSLS
jgi:hypothetical protein